MHQSRTMNNRFYKLTGTEGDVIMYFEEYGDRSNPTIIFLHCAAIVEIYAKQYSLADMYHIIVPHLYGSGKEVQTDFNFEENEKAVVNIIENILKEKVYIVGHSEGGNLAFALVSHYPQLFYKVIISSPMIDKSDKIAKLKSVYVSAIYPIIKSRWIGKAYIKLLGIKDEGKVNFFLEYWTKISKKTWQNYYTDRITFEKCQQFKSITVPVLCILGSKEPKAIEQTVQTITKINSDCSVKLIQGVGHEHPINKANELQQTILDYFGKQI